jgi:hypothetical protein
VRGWASTNSDLDLQGLRERYAHLSTEELLRVIHAPQDYRQEAIQVAKGILAQRQPQDLDALTTAVIADLSQEQEVRHGLAEEPLGPLAKGLCFVFCGIPGIAFAAYQGSKGKARRSREAWTWVGFGWAARVGLGLLSLALSGA